MKVKKKKTLPRRIGYKLEVTDLDTGRNMLIDLPNDEDEYMRVVTPILHFMAGDSVENCLKYNRR